MSQTNPSPIDALPDAPSTASPSTFAVLADAFLGAFAVFRTQLNALATVTYTNAVDAYNNATASAATAVISANAAIAAVNAPGTSATSTTSATIGLGSQALTIQTGKSLVPGMWVIAADTTNPAVNYMAGPITNYNSGTGALVFTAKVSAGAGTLAAWTVSLTAAATGSIASLTGTLAQFNTAVSDDDLVGVASKDATGGVPGLTLFKINFKNAANTFTNFLTNATTAARTYTFPDKDITVAGLVDVNITNLGTDATTAATASKLVLRDANANGAVNNLLEGYATTVTAGGVTTLTAASSFLQYFTGASTQTVTLPVTSTLALGFSFQVVNNSTGAVTVNSSGANPVGVLAGGTSAVLTCILASGVTAASWSITYIGDVVASGKKLTVNNSLTLTGTDATTLNFPAVSANIGYLEMPQNSQSAAYTLVASDSGKHILHPSADTTARIFTLPANASVPYPLGTAITFVNQASAGVITIAITTDTMRLAQYGTTGSRTLATNGVATALKITATEWIISGVGLT